MPESYRIGQPVLVDSQPASVVSDFGGNVRVRYVLDSGLLDSLNTEWVARERVSTR